MRALVACLVLMTAIALPGVIVAATSSSAGTNTFYPSTSGAITVGQVQTLPAGTDSSGPPPSAPLIPAALALQVAFEQQCSQLRLVPEGSQVELQQTGGGSCPVKIILHTEIGVLCTYTNSCGTGELIHGNVRIVDTPPAIGPTVKNAVANLR